MKRVGRRLIASSVAAILLFSGIANVNGIPRVYAEDTFEEVVEATDEVEAVPEESTVVNAVGDEEAIDNYDYQQVIATVYMCNTCEVVDNLTDMSSIGSLSSGQQVHVIDSIVTDDEVWCLVESTTGAYLNGYVNEKYLISAQGMVEELYPDIVEDEIVEADPFEESIAVFPESYKQYLRSMHSEHPNWVFIAQDTGIDWNIFIAAEMTKDRSLVEANLPDSYKGKQEWAYDASTGRYIGRSGDNWLQASESAVMYFADPRNFLNDQGIFQFELLSYNPAYQNEEGVEKILAGTFMSNVNGNMPDDQITYGQTFCRVGQMTSISPYMLAARVRQEQGTAGSSPLISGSYPGYEGYYNFFNISAAGQTKEEIYENGLSRARDEEWNSRYRSILGGSMILGSKYITKGQDTLYLQKFHVVNNGYALYSHQYMQNIRGAANEAKTSYNTYSRMGIIDQNFVFKIPIYKNMPITPCLAPEDENGAKLTAFVSRLYTLILQREPDVSGLNYWVNRMRLEGIPASQVVEGFVYSTEFQNRRLSDEEYVEILYKALFDRDSDWNGKVYWLNYLKYGASRRGVLVGFVNSTEFLNLCNSFSVIRGSLGVTENRDVNYATTAFVCRLYQNVLDREPEVAGLNDWTGRLNNHQTNSYDIGYLFVFSQEFKNKNCSNEEYVKILYRTFLNREAEPAGLNDWVGRLNRGTSREEVLQGFIYSKEYRNLADIYGIE